MSSNVSRCYFRVKDLAFTNEHRDTFELIREQILELVDRAEQQILVQIPVIDWCEDREQVLEKILEAQRLPGAFVITRAWAEHHGKLV